MISKIVQICPPHTGQLHSEVEFSLIEKFCMKRSKFIDSKIIDAPKPVDAGIAAPEAQEFATQWTYKCNHQLPNMALGGIAPKQRKAMVA